MVLTLEFHVDHVVRVVLDRLFPVVLAAAGRVDLVDRVAPLVAHVDLAVRVGHVDHVVPADLLLQVRVSLAAHRVDRVDPRVVRVEVVVPADLELGLVGHVFLRY